MSVRLQKNLAITDLKSTNLNTYYCKILLMPFFGMNIENQGKKLLSFNFPLFWGPLLLGSTICSLLPSNIHFKNMIICMILERLSSKNFKTRPIAISRVLRAFSDRQTDRRTNGQTDRPADRPTNRPTDQPTNQPTDRPTD